MEEMRTTEVRYRDIYENHLPDMEYTMDFGPVSISHWGMINLGKYGAVFDKHGNAHWFEDGNPLV